MRLCLLAFVASLLSCGPPPATPEPTSDAGTLKRVDQGVRGSQVSAPPPRQLMEPAVLTKSDLPPANPVATPNSGDFVGAKTCAKCHADVYSTWRGSTHGRAGGRVDEVDVIPEIGGDPILFRDASVRFNRDRKGDLQFIVDEKHQPTRTFKIAAVVGGGHLYGGGTQAFFTELTDGKLALLPFDYSVTSKTWFCQSGRHEKWMPISPKVSIRDCEYPPYRFLGTGKGANCQDCHGSQIGLTYDEVKKRYETRFTSLAINCESCHGPGRAHVESARRGSPEPFEPLELGTKERSVQVCMGCHADKTLIHPGHLADGSSLPFFANLHLRKASERKLNLDGQVIKFSYQEAHYWSDCYRNGSMTCVDCHAPHSNRYRDIHGAPLEGRFDDGQCTGCHPSKGGDSAHSGHAPGVVKCTSCHMPMGQQAGVGPHIAYRRADHSIGSPKLERLSGRDESAPQVCRSCHQPQTDTWIREKWAEIFGPPKPAPPGAVALAEVERALDIPPSMPGMPPMTRRIGASAPKAFDAIRGVEESHRPLIMRALSALVATMPQMSAPQLPADVRLKLISLSRSSDLETAGAALAASLFLAPYEPELSHQAVQALKSHSPDRQLPLRRHIVFNLMAILYTVPEDSTGAMKVGIGALENYAAPLAEDPTSLSSLLAALYSQIGEPRRAVSALLAALKGERIQSGRYPLDTSGSRADLLARLAGLISIGGSNRGAIDRYREALAVDPNHKGAREELCVELIKGGQKREALKCVKRYVEINDDFVEGYFVMANLHEQLGEIRKAIEVTTKGLKRAPDNESARENLRRLQGRR